MAHAIHPWTRTWLGLSVQGDLGPLTIYTDKRAKTVFFLRAPPLNPPSPIQEYLREFFTQQAASWRASGRANRDNWQRAARAANLGISGYCLWVWFARTRDEGSLRTIERQSGRTLTRPP